MLNEKSFYQRDTLFTERYYENFRPASLADFGSKVPRAEVIPLKRKKSLKQVVTLAGLAVFFGIFVTPYLYENFVSPLFSSNKTDMKTYENVYSPATGIFADHHFLGYSFFKGVERNSPLMATLPLNERMPYLETELEKLAENYPSIEPSIFVYEPSSGNFAGLNPQKMLPAASIIKLPVLIELFRSVQAGKIDISDKMILTDFYRAEGSGDIQFQMTGREYTLDGLAKKMIEISDNSSTNMLMSLLGGMNDINKAVKDWGLASTEVNNWLPDMKGTNTTCTADLVRMLYNIDNSNFLNETSKQKILEYMGNVENTRLLKAGLNPDAKIWHKTGDIGHTLGDAGIVETPEGKRYIVAILAKRPYNSPAGKEFIVAASSLIYNAISNG